MFKTLALLLFFPVMVFADFDWQAHRGGRGLHPENTIDAMKEALKYPITTLELDVVISKDQKIVVSHEPWMNPEICLDPKGKKLKGPKINLYKLTYEEIRKYDCGSKPHPRFPRQIQKAAAKPLLKDLLDELKNSGKKFNIEIKSTVKNERKGFQPEHKRFSDEVVSFLLKELPPEQFTIQSFDWRVLRYIHQKYPQVQISALKDGKFKRQDVLKELGFSPTIFSPNYEDLSAADVAYFHKKNINVIPWTVNSPDGFRKMIAMHVDGIITDYPDLISSIPPKSYTLVPDCGADFNRFEGKCVKIPTHAEASEQNPGWVCKAGYVQKRYSCVKIRIPENASFLEDGKSWVCNEGFERYRLSCRPVKD